MAHFNQGLSVPPLRPDDRIEDWEPLFRASVGHLTVQGEEGIKTVIGLIPAMVNRRTVESEISKEAVKCASLDEAFKLLRETLDPPVDVFEATLQFHEMKWQPGVQVDDHFVRLMRMPKRAKATIRMGCTTMTAQLPKEIQGTLKGWLAEKGDELTEADARIFMVKIKTTLTESGIATDKGYRDFERILETKSPNTDQPEGDETAPVITPPHSDDIPEEEFKVHAYRANATRGGGGGYSARGSRYRADSRACRRETHAIFSSVLVMDGDVLNEPATHALGKDTIPQTVRSIEQASLGGQGQHQSCTAKYRRRGLGGHRIETQR